VQEVRGGGIRQGNIGPAEQGIRHKKIKRYKLTILDHFVISEEKAMRGCSYTPTKVSAKNQPMTGVVTGNKKPGSPR